MRMIPNVAPQAAHSAAERRLFLDLAALKMPTDYRCLHSVHLRAHLRQRMGELDFVIVGPRGVLVLEVKGGRVSCKDGLWYFENRWGEVNSKRRSPFQQAEEGMFSLKRLLREEGLSENEEYELSYGYGVVFPDVDYDSRGVEWPREVVLDDHRWRTQGLKDYLRDLEDYWLDKNSYAPATSSSALLEHVTELMRPDFEVVESPHALAESLDARIRHLTEDQYRTLDLALGTERLLVEGSAGTGKTFLAAETARREAAVGRRVLFVCLAPLLAANLRGALAETAGVRVEALHDLMLDTVRQKGQLPSDYRPGRTLTDPWFSEKLVPAFAQAANRLGADEQYDVLVVDEAQDILTLVYLSAVGSLLRGGLEHGRWRIFYDRFNQGGLFGASEPGVLELLQEVATSTPPPLRVNCRNTDPIVLQTKLITGADMGVASTGRGPAVLIRSYPTQQEAAVLLEGWLQELYDDQIEPRHITILSPRSFLESTAALLPGRWTQRLEVLDGTNGQGSAAHSLTFATIADFKGLENRFVGLVDIEDVDGTEAALAMVYVGMTRARVQLWMAVQESAHLRLERLISSRLAAVLEDTARAR